MTFKDKEKEINEWIEEKSPNWFVGICEDDNTVELGFSTSCHGIFSAKMTENLILQIYCPITKFIFYTKEERNLIDEFTKFLEELGFKEGE